jgi:hypothetical protein
VVDHVQVFPLRRIERVCGRVFVRGRLVEPFLCEKAAALFYQVSSFMFFGVRR